MKTPCNRIIMMASIFLLMFGTVQIPPAISHTEAKITLESAVQTALRENPELGTIHKKIEVARARLNGIALLGNPELETEFVGGLDGQQTSNYPSLFS